MAEAARHDRLILASGSAARRSMLAAAGLAFDVVPSHVDETALKQELDTELLITADFPVVVARSLASAKAMDVSQRVPDALVIGADQTLAVEMSGDGSQAARMLDKPADVAEARRHLLLMRSRTHVLHAAVVLAQAGEIVWRHDAAAQMSMRPFSDAFLEDYLARAGDKVLGSVGCYQLEGLGLQLFERIEGDYFTILGMPLLPLLNELRRRKVIAT